MSLSEIKELPVKNMVGKNAANSSEVRGYGSPYEVIPFENYFIFM